MFTSRFALALDTPTASAAGGQDCRLMLLGPALERYRQCLKRESLGLDGMWDIGEGEVVGPGELWTTEAGKVFVQPRCLSAVCATLQVACSLNFRQIRILYPENGDIDLHGLFDFLLLKAPLKVIVEADGHLREQVESRLAQFELQYQIPDLPATAKPLSWVQRLLGAPVAEADPEVDKMILENARFLLRYEAERDPTRMGKTLHLLRHLNDTRLCLQVMEAHRAFFATGEFESDKTYPRQGDGERVAGYLNQLYQWAQTPGWMRARKTTTVPSIPPLWRATSPHLKVLQGPPPRPRATSDEVC